jgi:adenylate kinase family enzyme
VTSLDSIVWQPGWRKTPPDERRVREEQAIRAPSWIIEGVSARVRAAADLVIFLDVPRVVCVRRSLTRGLRHLGRTRPDLPPGCPEWRIVLRLLGIIRRFPDLVGREIRREAAAEPDRYRIVTWAGSGEGVPARGPRRYRSRR